MSLIVPIVMMALIFFGIYQAMKNVNKDNPFMRIDDDAHCVGPHDWSKAHFLTNDEHAKLLANPTDYNSPGENYCKKCGLIPHKQVMVKPEFLQKLAAQELAIQAAQQRLADLNELRQNFFAQYVELAGFKDARDVRLLAEGYNVHEKFINHLPELMAARSLRRQRDDFVQEVAAIENQKKKA